MRNHKYQVITSNNGGLISRHCYFKNSETTYDNS